MVQDRFVPVSFASISATSTTLYTRRFDLLLNRFCVPQRKLDDGTIEEVKPPIFKEHQGGLSSKASRNLRKSINTLLIGVNEEILLSGKGKENVTFATLTLPSSQFKSFDTNKVEYYATDKEIKRNCFNQLMTELKQTQGVNNYVWVCEKQVNGNLHFHILFDKRINWEWLRTRWNGLINKYGFVDRYQERFKSMNFEQYVSYCTNGKKADEKRLNQLKKAFDFGQKTNWKQPNSTDIQALKKVNNVAAYISKYMSKGFGHSESKIKKYASALSAKYNLTDNDIRKIYTVEGRIWQCSQVIAKARKCISYCEVDFIPELDNLIETEKDIQVFKEERFTTILHTIKQLKQKCNSIYETFLSHIRKYFNGMDNFDITSTSSNSVCDIVAPVSNRNVFQTKLSFT
ncbi:hypothetical protein D0T49_03070 [Paludibacter sp. 221]|uniref:rolling circle replication-associated protein n=1 Tax=Paludibacter sp. 221 TaxID=2302939 RepID=UPI0013D43823|nr:hypothetical protein [Paludibacter sp. 221]NDV46021.1 hypothetical protein [Paludibacter sp. 221]